MSITYKQLANVINEMNEEEKQQPALVFLHGEGKYCLVENTIISDGTVNGIPGDFLLVIKRKK